MTEWIKYVLDWLKTSPRYFFPVAVFCGFILFVPEFVLQPFGLNGPRIVGKPYFGAAFLFSVATIVCSGILRVFTWAREEYRQWLWIRHGIKYLHGLTGEEKAVLRRYLEDQTRSRRLDIKNGVVIGLAKVLVISQVSGQGHIGYGGAMLFAFNIQPWAWDYLNAHPELIGLSHDKTS